MKMNTYVNFADTCAEAFGYYEKHLGCKSGHGDDPRTGTRVKRCYT